MDLIGYLEAAAAVLANDAALPGVLRSEVFLGILHAREALPALLARRVPKLVHIQRYFRIELAKVNFESVFQSDFCCSVVLPQISFVTCKKR